MGWEVFNPIEERVDPGVPVLSQIHDDEGISRNGMLSHYSCRPQEMHTHSHSL